MIIIITGKAGSGKTTLRKLLLEKLANFPDVYRIQRECHARMKKMALTTFISKKDFFEKDDIFLKREENGSFYGVDKNSFQNFSCFSCKGVYARIIGLKLSWQPDGQFGHRFLRNYVLSFVLRP